LNHIHMCGAVNISLLELQMNSKTVICTFSSLCLRQYEWPCKTDDILIAISLVVCCWFSEMLGLMPLILSYWTNQTCTRFIMTSVPEHNEVWYFQFCVCYSSYLI
jgi:hypothetical protein